VRTQRRARAAWAASSPTTSSAAWGREGTCRGLLALHWEGRNQQSGEEEGEEGEQGEDQPWPAHSAICLLSICLLSACYLCYLPAIYAVCSLPTICACYLCSLCYLPALHCTEDDAPERRPVRRQAAAINSCQLLQPKQHSVETPERWF
jgi:hypothetical protein